MFEKLAGNVISKILSKYFTDESLARNKATKSAHWGIWSGYITLQNLEIKTDIINAKLRQKGQPLELVRCSLRQVEITIPWAKVSGTGSSGNGFFLGSSSQDAVAVLVLDGVHVLFRTSFLCHDDELRTEEIKKRREALSRSENFAKSTPQTGDDMDFSFEERKTYTEMLKQRITSGLVQEILDKLHIHIRDLHIRIEDVTDSEHPCAFGITMESMHVQDARGEEKERMPSDEIVEKVALMNHFAAYWNALDYGDDIPIENSILHEACVDDAEKLSSALDSCIVRRDSLIAPSSRTSYIPTHTFLLLPTGVELRIRLSNKPKDLSSRPALEIDIELDSIHTNLRDFQCVQMLKLYKERKNFQFIKKYRRFRPKSSVMDDPKAWWSYAARVIRFELRDNFLRWSWSRFETKYAIRARYVKLYEKRIRPNSRAATTSSWDDMEDKSTRPLTQIEYNELQDLEDGIHGDLSVTDIILYRALVNMRVGGYSNTMTNNGSNGELRSSGLPWWQATVQDATVDDIEAREEFDRLLQYLDRVPNNSDTSRPEMRNDSLVAIRITIQVEAVRFALFSPLSITSEETQLKRLHEKFLEFNSQGMKIGGTLNGDYKNYGLEFSIVNFTVCEIRKDKSQHVVASQLKRDIISLENEDREFYERGKPLLYVNFTKNPTTNPGVNKELHMLLNPLEFNLNIDCQWIGHLKSFMAEVASAPNVAQFWGKFWGELSLAHLNSLALGKLGLMAKAESVALDHENLDVDIALHCPVFRIGMGNDGDLVIDLGFLSLKTDRLAGISHNTLINSPLIRNGGSGESYPAQTELRQSTTDESSLTGSNSSRIPSSIFRNGPMTTAQKPFRNLSSGISVDSLQASERGNRSFAGSFNLEDGFPSTDLGSEKMKSRRDSGVEELFYDKYRLCLQTGKMTFSGESEIFDISMGFELRTTIQKSVIPTDHTLWKLKAHTVIDRIQLVINEDLLSRFAVAFRIWKSLVQTNEGSQLYKRGLRSEAYIPSADVGRFIPDRTNFTYSDDSDGSESVSEIDEGEFFDAHQASDSVGENASGIWFEDNWITDAESVIDGGSKGSSNDRRSHRRARSVSDVSSMSDHSKHRRGQFDNLYLNAENLARLEEGVGEDDSIAESGQETDNDSFHSVMSHSGQAQLLRDLQKNIQELEAKIDKFATILAENAHYVSRVDDTVLQERRNTRKKTKHELRRSQIELKAMKAVCYDLDVLLSDDHNDYTSDLNKEVLNATTIQHARTAKALMLATQRRESNANNHSGHKLVQHLNRELFKGSVTINEIQLKLRTDDQESECFDDPKISEFVFTLNQMAMVLLNFANDTRIYFTLDQATANVAKRFDKESISSALLFSGGSSDTPLPAYLPHLVAHSMEDRFIRAVIGIRKHRSVESSRQLTKLFRVRLVVGDVEVLPYPRSIIPMLQCLRCGKTTGSSSESELREVCTQASKKQEKLKKIQQYFDFAIRLTSIRLALTQEDRIIGASVVSESSLRVLRLASEVRDRIQADFRCSNAQVLDITNIETGRGSELLGRRDPYSSLCQFRLRSQLVPSNERGGWVTGFDKPETENKNAVCDVRNVHMGIKISPLSLLASPDAVSKLCKSGHELRKIFQNPKNEINRQTKSSTTKGIVVDIPLRWRFDFVLRRVIVRFPEESKIDWNTSADIGNKMVMAFTSVLSVRESTKVKNRVSVRMGITDISLIRSYDDWPILEPFSILFEFVLMSKFISHLAKKRVDNILSLIVKAESPLNEIDIVMARHGWNSIPSRKTNNETSTLILKISPLKVNTSISVVSLLGGILQSFKTSKVDEKKGFESPPTPTLLPSANSMVGKHQFGIQISIEDAEIRLLRENDLKPIAYASRLLSFTMTDVSIDYSQGEQVIASILIRDSALFDLSSGKGIRVIGEDPEARLDFPYFVRIKFLMHFDGIQTIRLHVNWGRIQCLILPSFFRSILDLKDALKNSNGGSQKSSVKQKRKDSLLHRFLRHPNDVNLNLSADAETFECILASKDIVEYVKSGNRDPFGVVTFRWKASLGLAIALDCLQESSMPWLTLNLDGNFTDENDINLFREFSNNYLGKNSESLVDSDSTGCELVNTFTTKVNYKLSSFQAVRTNITLMELEMSSQNSFTVMPRICFKISQPVAGEQRISNPIDLMLLYRATGASMTNSAFKQSTEYEVKLAQLLDFQANFVDVLLYISSKSTGGFSDSFRVSMKPILDMLIQNDAKRAPKDSDSSMSCTLNVRNRQMPSLIDLMKSSPFICRMQIEGFLVTCVPGGATRLNESPIIKFELSNISSGVAAVPVDQNLSVLAGRGGNQDKNSSRQYIAGSEIMNVTIGGWVSCKVTGHYHNRRLVAWEPFIEPWTASISFGIDLVEACHWKPITKQEASMSRTSTNSSFLDISKDEPPEKGKDRLKEIGRLIRSPFQSLQSSASTRKGAPHISYSDLCYLMLSSSARSTILSTQYERSGSRSEIESNLFNTLPSKVPLEWLHRFGKPRKSPGSGDSCNPFSVSVVLADTMPLNINLTGALIENVMGYLTNTKRTNSNAIVPHLIRNSSGMVCYHTYVSLLSGATFLLFKLSRSPFLCILVRCAVCMNIYINYVQKTLRFREVLDTDRKKRCEHASKIVLANGSEAPLTLKRSLSQTCDPHRAYIYLELGGFEDTVGRVNHDDFDIPKGRRSANFLFKATAKIPVDAVGVHRYPLDRNVKARADVRENGSNSRALGWIIVRVALKGSVKVVSIESPFVLKNAADTDLLCEVRDESGLSLLWRCLIPKADGSDSSGKKDGIVSVPADIVPLIHDESYRFSIAALSHATSSTQESAIISTKDEAVEISPPPPFSPKSFSRGLIGEEEIILPTLIEPNELIGGRSNEKIFLTSCAVRIGNASFSRVDSAIEVPEQRMIFFRSPLVIRNFLALPIAVQVRVKSFSNRILISNANGNSGDGSIESPDWTELGVLDCGESLPWTGSRASDKVQLRVKFVGTDGDNSRRYPGWSSPVNVPAREVGARANRSTKTRIFSRMKVSDADNVALNLSVAFDFCDGSSGMDHTEDESIRNFCQKFSSATRAACIFVPFWIIDGTHQDLEFFAGSPVAGQLDKRLRTDREKDSGLKYGSTLGLAELMDNQNFLNASSGSGFDVLMIGDENSPRLTVRKRLARSERNIVQSNNSPWSDSIPLRSGRKARHDLTVVTSDDNSGTNTTINDDGQSFDRLVLRSIIMNANDRFGGQYGTRLIHIVNRYSISNETGRDIEIAANAGSSSNLIVSATTRPQPFHFDDSREIRFRFKEFGWAWSGFFKVRLNRREVTMRLRHKMKGQTIIVTVEVRAIKKSATYLVVFHESSHPPFRLENHTMYPLSFGQSLSGLGSEDNDCDSLLLQYQNENFAWDEPELTRRALLLKSSVSMNNPRDMVFGRFPLDKIAPGTILQLESELFAAEVVADGPTRVLRISDASMPRISSVRHGDFEYFRSTTEVSKPLTTSLSIRISYGIGISIVDFSPKELLYIYLEDVDICKKTDNKKDDVHFAIGNIKVNNQLWVTPYPVFLKMGRRNNGKNSFRRRNRRHDAVSISWRSSLNTHGGYGNLTLLDWIEISSEPIFANVDGELVAFLFRMARQVAYIRSSDESSSTFQSRDEELKSLLKISGTGEFADDCATTLRIDSALQNIAAGGTVTTAAVAAKLRDSPVYNQQATPRSGHYLIQNAARKRKKPPLSKVEHKFYIERLKISTTKADLSWSGVLPGLLSASLFKALTFERLPMRLRPFSNTHSYGNLEDHLQILRSHYMSIWRVVDLLMGLSSNPTFLFRGVVHTLREGSSSVLDSFAFSLKNYSRELNELLPRDSKLKPIYDDGNLVQDIEHRTSFLNRFSAPFVNGLAFALNNTSLIVTLFSMQMKYSPKSSSARLTRGLVRSRNPRLFAHLDGKDLLVEYVEGENAGKALLSRVRAGRHLGEGYFYHAEGARQRKSYFKGDIDPVPLILMITVERILLLTGKLDENFCSVEWEAYFTNIIHIDLFPGDEKSNSSYDEVIVWHLLDPEFSEGNRVDKGNQNPKNLALGIDVLHSKSIFVPCLTGEQVLKKMELFDSRI